MRCTVGIDEGDRVGKMVTASISFPADRLTVFDVVLEDTSDRVVVSDEGCADSDVVGVLLVTLVVEDVVIAASTNVCLTHTHPSAYCV